MSSSALCYAVRRLGGRALQRAQRSYAAAAEDVQGSRTVRPTSSRRSNSSTSGGAATSSTEHATTKSAVERPAKEYLASIQQKKIQSKQEELFQLIAKMDRELPDHCGKDNRQLLMYLSERVQPKPSDPQWRFYRKALTYNHCVLYGCLFYLGYLAVVPKTRDV